MSSSFPAAMTVICASLLATLAAPLVAQGVSQLEGKNVSIAQTTFKGRSAVQLNAAPDALNGASYAVVKDSSFRDGTIEVDLAGQPAAGAGGGARGFIGIAFRLQADGRYEYIYLRPTNGRADDQVRRNHSTQYSAHPDFDFARSRKEAPEKYESVRRSAARRLDEVQDRGGRPQGTALRARGGATRPHRQRPQARAPARTSGPLGRPRHRRLLRQSEDHGQVGASPQKKTAGGVNRRPSLSGRLKAARRLPGPEATWWPPRRAAPTWRRRPPWPPAR